MTILADKSTRATLLESAHALTEGDRNTTYGDPIENMAVFAALVTAYIDAVAPSDLRPQDGAWLMVLAKMARCRPGLPYHADNYIDAAAYAAMAGECAERGDA